MALPVDQVAGFDVSRETYDKLQSFEVALKKWSSSINLISRHTIDDIWHRHIEDSAQIFGLSSHTPSMWTDLGSGGGLPAIVVAILSSEQHPANQTTMIESDQRKAAFLRSQVRELMLNANVIADRIEAAPPQNAPIVSARALAPLDRLLPLIQRHLAPDGQALLMKGRRWQEEVDNARQGWTFECEAHTSITDPASAILSLKDIARV